MRSLTSTVNYSCRVGDRPQYKKYEGAPHGLNITHKDQFNEDLVTFLEAHAPQISDPLLARRQSSSELERAH
jgi:hypothetical protein